MLLCPFIHSFIRELIAVSASAPRGPFGINVTPTSFGGSRIPPASVGFSRRPRRPSLQIGGTPWTVIRGVAEPDDVCQVALTCRAQPPALAWRHAALGRRRRRWAAVALGRRRLVGAA